MKKFEFNKSWLVPILSIVIFGILYTLMAAKIIDNYIKGLLISAFINVTLAVSLNLASGYLGQLTLGHAGFMSIGAYVSALLSIHLDCPFPLALLCGALVAALAGFLIGLPTLRLKGDYLCIITLAFNEIIRTIMINLDITNGSKGLVGIPKLTTFFVVYVCAMITIYVVYALIHSKHGRAIRAIKEDETASELAGINLTYFKILAFTVSALFAGLAGGLYAHYITIIVPKVFNYNKSVEILVIVVLGGMGNLTGSIVSALALTFLPELLRSFDSYRMLIYAIVLIVAMIIQNNEHIANWLHHTKAKIQERFKARKEEL